MMFSTLFWCLRRAGLARHIGLLAGFGRELAALAIARVLKVDPVVGEDVLGWDAVTLLQKTHEDQPGLDLLRRHRLAHVGKIAGEFDADGVGSDDAMKRL